MFRAVCSLIAAMAALASSLASAAPPNIILVMPDDVGYGDFACLGNPIIKTPAIDAFWRQSVRFTDFHVSPTCAPTRAALLTGRHEFKNGVTHTILERERLSLAAATLADVLRQGGYATGIFGKWHQGDEPDRWPDKRGFDEMFIHGAGGIGQSYEGSCGDAPGNSYFSPVILHNGRFERTDGYCTDVFFRQATSWIDSVRGQRPFFAYIAPNAAHGPLHVAEEYQRPYAGKVNADVAKFYGMIANIDENFGRLIEQLDAWGIADDTLVIFMTDNGGTSGVKVYNAGMRGRKNSPYQGGTRVPSFWRMPGRFAGGVDCAPLTAHVDILPTLAEIAGVELDDKLRAQVEGRSLLPLLNDPQAAWADRFFVTHCGRWERGQAENSKHALSSIRNARYNLVEDKDLYDLHNDPGEQRNVIDEHPEVVALLRTEYNRWWADILPRLENESAVGPAVNPFKELYRKQFGVPGE